MTENNNDLTGGELTEVPEKYQKFFARFEEIKTLPLSDWKAVHLLAYFCQKYQGQYNLPYQFKFNTPSPAKCFEVFHIKRLSMLLSSQPTILRDYIDWVYSVKVPQTKRRFTSISFLTKEETINEYKFNVLLASINSPETINRATVLPTEYQAIFERAGINIKTYGDFAFLSQINPPPNNLMMAIDDLKQLGFDFEVLKKII